MTELAGKTCTPCRGGVPPLERTEAERYLREAPGWALLDDGKGARTTYEPVEATAARVTVEIPASALGTGVRTLALTDAAGRDLAFYEMLVRR